MIVIRRLIDRRGSFTALMLPGEPARIFPTTDHEHGRLLQIYKQDRPYTGIHNDFSAYALGHDTLPAPPSAAAPAGEPVSSPPSPVATAPGSVSAPGSPAPR